MPFMCGWENILKPFLFALNLLQSKCYQALESSCAMWTPKTPFGRFWLVRQVHQALDTFSVTALSWIRACSLVGVIVQGFGG